MTALEDALLDAGGLAAPPARHAQLRAKLATALAHGQRELARSRSGYGTPVEVAVAADGDGLWAAAPVDAAFRADPAIIPDRAWTVVAALVGALFEVAELPPPTRADDLVLRAGAVGEGKLLLHVPGTGDGELAALAFEDAVADVDRLRAAARAVPAALLAPEDGLRAPIGAIHPLRVAEAVSRLGGRPTDPHSVQEYEAAVFALIEPEYGHVPPHDDPDPGRRVARRILRRLDGMGKWGGYHTEWAHLARGFAGHDRELAYEVGRRLLAAGLLDEKPSVGQRHVFLNAGRSGDIRALIERGTLPSGLHLP